MMRKHEKSSTLRNDKTLFHFEKTTGLIQTGVFRYIRHPLYGSLIYLTWGICLKNLLFIYIGIALISTVLFYITSRYDEKECTLYFGEEYVNYMKGTRMFIPFVF
jgi:protein-S-isoprenylcysteine O-methyltransferase Ste14